MKKRSNPVFAAAILLMVAFITIHCQRSAEKQQEKMLEKALEQGGDQKANVDIEGENVTIEREGNKVEIKTGAEKWPDDVLNDVPELSAGKIFGTTISDMEGGYNWSIRFKDVEIAELDRYGAKLKAEGFKITTMKMGKGGMVTGEKGSISVIFTVSPEMSVVSITTSDQ